MKWTASIVKILFFGLFLYIVSTGNMMLWLAMFGVSLIVGLFFGRVYCGYMCPMNTTMPFVEKLSKKLGIQSDETPKWLEKGILPWLALGVSIIVMIASKRALQMNIPIMLIWLGVSLIVTLRYPPAVFHNLICPFGALQRLFGRGLSFEKKVDTKKCIGCKKCESVCPSLAILVSDQDKKAYIKTNQCFQCNNCSDVCPVSAIHYQKNQ